jgi:hypothetical protein
MCFSSNASIISFLFGIIGSILVFTLGSVSNKIIGGFIGFVSLMQFIEYLLWNHQICDNYNKFLSILGMILNHMQPIVLGLLILLFNKSIQLYNYKIILSVLFIYLILIIPYSVQFNSKYNLQCTLKSMKHLKWNWISMNYSHIIYISFLLAIILLFIYGLPSKKLGIIVGCTAFITFFTSFIIYPQEFIGALWCFYTAFIPIIYYLFYKLSGFIE